MILDFGCGEGLQWEEYSDDVIGIDVNLTRLRTAKRHLQAVRCDGTVLPFRRNAFCAIISFSVLEHVTDPQRALFEMTRVLASGGTCLIKQPVDNDPIFILARRAVRNWQGDPIRSRFTTQQLLEFVPAAMHVNSITYTSNAPIAGVFAFLGLKIPRALRGFDQIYDLFCRASHALHWQVQIVAVKL